MVSLNSLTIEAISNLIGELPHLHDERPDWLKAAAWALYYRLLFELGRRLAGRNMLEIGTYRGWSAASYSLGGGGTVVTIDIDPTARDEVAKLRLPNIVAITANSRIIGPEEEDIRRHAPYDVMFVDGSHDTSAFDDFDLRRQHLSPGAVVLFDDIVMFPGARESWERVPAPKLSADVLHHSGFGIHKLGG